MKLDSKYFDSIRVKPDQDRTARETHPTCQWRDCDKPGLHRAPKGRGREGEYYLLCSAHVRAYNKSYNYFSGMTDEDLDDYRRSADLGHRPTWEFGRNSDHVGGSRGLHSDLANFDVRRASDPHGLLGEGTCGESPNSRRRPRIVGKLALKSVEALHLDEYATATDIRARFKTLVKRHHPDTNGGDRSSEDKLREVIQAYNTLRQAGYC